MKLGESTLVNLGYEQVSKGYKSESRYRSSNDYKRGWDYYMNNKKEETK